VLKDSDGSTMGCHSSKSDADQQLAALYANEPRSARMLDLEVTRAAAARARRDALQEGNVAGSRLARSAAPLDVGNARTLAFPAVLRASLHKRDCDCAEDCDCDDCDDSSTGWLWSRSPSEIAEKGLWHRLHGVASVVEKPYEMWDMFGPYTEKVSARAFDDSLSRQPDVAFLVNHKGLTMARTTNETLKLSATPEGLATDAWLNPLRMDVSDLMVAVKDGCVDQMSFAAMMEDGEWDDDYSTFTMLKLDLHCGDVSAVNFGANPHTSISARAHRLLNEVDRLPSGAARAALNQLQARFDIKPKTESNGRSISLVRSALLADEG
jgi:HK97 family phage prohead protease